MDIELYLVPSNHQTLIWFIDHFKEITEAWTLFFFPEIGQHSPALMVFFRVIDWYIILWLWEPRFSNSQLLYHCEAEKREREREKKKERWEVLSMCWVLSRQKKKLLLVFTLAALYTLNQFQRFHVFNTCLTKPLTDLLSLL